MTPDQADIWSIVDWAGAGLGRGTTSLPMSGAHGAAWVSGDICEVDIGMFAWRRFVGELRVRARVRPCGEQESMIPYQWC